MDYACGAGHLLACLATRFPGTQFLGLDGSSFLLDQARRRIERLGRRAGNIRLREILLPDFGLDGILADVVVYTFPNMVPSHADTWPEEDEAYLEFGDRAAAGILARSCHRDRHPDKDTEAVRAGLIFGRLVSLNLRTLLRSGGFCVRVEYAKVRRGELSGHDLMLIEYEEGSLEARLGNSRPRCWFRVLASSFFRSGVSEDVYQQTLDERDKSGGYVITVLRAI